MSKAHSDFHKRAASNDGLAARCKQCQREYDFARRDDPDRAAHRAANRPKYREKHNKVYTKRWIEKHPEKRAAHVVVGNAIRDGKLAKKPCEVCSEIEVHAHHDDYTKPLDVRWLCVKHHGETRRIDPVEAAE